MMIRVQGPFRCKMAFGYLFLQTSYLDFNPRSRRIGVSSLRTFKSTVYTIKFCGLAALSPG